MPSKLLKDGRPLALQAKEFTSGEWAPPKEPLHPAMVPDAFHPDNSILQNTIWRRDVSNMPLAENSAAMAQWMWDKTPDPWGTKWHLGTPNGGWGAKTSLNTSRSGTQPIAAYVVDSTHPSAEYAWMECRSDGMTTLGWDATLLDGVPRQNTARDSILSGRIPLPKGALPAIGGDEGMALYDIGTGIWREYFNTRGPLKDRTGPNGEPVYTASVGGWSVNKPGRDISSTNFATQTQSGQSAIACMHNSLGFIHPDEVRAGAIEHALAFTFGAVACSSVERNAQGQITRKFSTPSWPAAGSDAKAPPEERPFSPTHGQWARVDPNLDPMHNPRTNRPFNPLTRLLIRAAQKYGLVGTDTNGWCHAFNGHSGVPEMLYMGKTKDPWELGGEVTLSLSPDNPNQALDVSDFPWDHTQWAPVDWGRPDIDFYVRRNNYDPYVKEGAL